MKSICLFAIDAEDIDNAIVELMPTDMNGKPIELENDEMREFLDYLDSMSWSGFDHVFAELAEAIRGYYESFKKARGKG